MAVQWSVLKVPVEGGLKVLMRMLWSLAPHTSSDARQRGCVLAVHHVMGTDIDRVGDARRVIGRNAHNNVFRVIRCVAQGEGAGSNDPGYLGYFL